MKLGIKVGLQKQSFADLEATNPQFAEVWFNILQKDNYVDLFQEMKRRSMTIGLHFWGHLPDHTGVNIALPDKTIVEPSMALIKETIDIAARHKGAYVIIHPSTRSRVAIDFQKQSFEVLNEPIPEQQAEDIFMENLYILSEYAKQRNVLFVVETVPSQDTNGWHGNDSRKKPFDIYSLDNSVIVKAATRGFTVANDFGHTSCTVQSDNRAYVWSTLIQMTKKIFHQTKVIHLGYIIPPYNGTDFHDHLDNSLFESSQAVPNKAEMIDILRMFKDREDVFALVEPDGRHIENYFAAQKLIEAASI